MNRICNISSVRGGSDINLNAAIFTTHRHWPGPLIGCGVHLHTVGLLEVSPNRWRALLPSVTVTVNQATGYTRATGNSYGITTPWPWPGRVSSSSQQTAPSLPQQSESGPLPSLRRSQARLQRLARMVRGTYAFSPSESRARGMMIFELHPNLNLISVSLRARRRRPGPPTKLQKPGEL